MGRPVQAVETLDRVLAAPAELSAEDLKRAVETRAQQQRRIARVRLQTKQAGAVVEVDGLRVGTTPLSEPIKVATGTRRISVVATGFHPFNQEITIAGGETRSIPVELVPLEQKTGKLRITTQLPDVEVRVDGTVVGRTPLSGSLTVAPGTHRVELTRAGYGTASAEVTVVEDATREVALEPERDPAAPASVLGELELELSELDATVYVDEAQEPTSTTRLMLPRGRHALRVERSGFVPYERDIDVQPGATTKIRVELLPTSETRAAWAADARQQRTWGWVTSGAGLAVAAGGVGYLVYNAHQVDDAQQKYDAIVYESERGSGRRCDRLDPDTNFAECEEELNTRYDNLQSAQDLTKYGYVGVGVGAAVLGLGVVLLLTADDPEQYDQSQAEASPRWTVTPLVGAGAEFGGAAIRARF